MVGIPGKSQGCHTCRRRKIRCDLQKPDCARCTGAGRVCEGYVRGPVFLNRTAQGWEKRKRLEEVQPRQTTPPDSSVKQETTSQPDASVSPPLLYRPSVQMNNAKVRKQMFQGLFLESYLPKSSKSGYGLNGAWIVEAVRLDESSSVLNYSLHALCLTRVGRISAHADLTKRGTAAYGLALQALRKALASSTLARKDETLAACFLLSIYELYESTSNSTSAHEEHMVGIERLVQYRGHQQQYSPLGKALMKNIIYASMIRSLQYRKISSLKDIIDKMQWWDIQGELFGRGHTLGALLEDLDAYKNSGQHSLAASAEYLKRCTTLDAEFEALHDQLLKESPSPIYWSVEDEFEFVGLQLAHVMLDYWALRLVLSTTIDIICSQVPREIPPTMAGYVGHLKTQHGASRQVELASNIMLSMPYCMSDEHGVSSSQKCLFSGRVALFALRKHSSDRLPGFEKTFNDLAIKKGLKFAENIDKKEMTNWKPHISEK